MLTLTSQQQEAQKKYQNFANEYIKPLAAQHDQTSKITPDLIKQIAQTGYLSTIFPFEYGGQNTDMVTFGLLNEEFGKACAATRGLLTVQSMVGMSILKWGSTEQKNTWIPKLAAGETIAAFALTEPNIGSDAKNIQMTAEEIGNHYVLNGTKKWTSFGQIAGLFLIFAKCSGKIAAFLLPRNSEGLTVEPINNLLGMRGCMLAKITLQNCRIPKENLLGRVGFGFTHIMTTGLDYGRYSVACGCVGLAQACLEQCIKYVKERQQFGVPIKEHQLVRHIISDMMTNIAASRSLCYQAGLLKDIGNPENIFATIIAKYFSAKAAYQIASDAVQIHGANGCSSDYPVERYLRDAKIMEIIEGSNEILQNYIAQAGYRIH